MFSSGKMCYCPFFGHLVVIKCEYKAQMKCAWAAEISRMKSSVQLGLLCLSLFISSLHGEEEVETNNNLQMPSSFDELELHQSEMHRVRRQTVSTEKENPAKTVGLLRSENSKIKRKRSRPGGLTPLGDIAQPIYHRTKRQEKIKNNKPKKRPGSHSILESLDILPPPQETVEMLNEK